MSKRRASSPAERPSPSKLPKKSNSQLSALAPVFVPRSDNPPPTPAPFRPLFKSEPITVEDSVFQARLFRLDDVQQQTKILAYMKRHYTDAQHHMAAWRSLIVKDGMTGLEGAHAFMIDAGCRDDGESRGGKTVMDVLEKSGLTDVLVVVSRRFGGTLLGPARFTHIADCARAVCNALYEQEKAQERAAKVADLVALLMEQDTEVAELRFQMSRIDAKRKRESEEQSTGETAKEPGDKKPTISLSLKPPDYTNLLDPPDIEKAERLLQARKKTVQTLKLALEKKKQSQPGDAPQTISS